MIQKKKPILLISIVGTLVLVVIIGNLSQFLRDPNRFQDIPAPNQETLDKLKERQNQAVSPDGAVEAMMDNAMGARAGAGMSLIGDVPDTASILLPSVKTYEPEYEGPNKTTGQWYQEDSYQQTEAEKRRTAIGQDD